MNPHRILVWLVAAALLPPTLIAIGLAWLRPVDAPPGLAVSLLAASLLLIAAARMGGKAVAGWVLAACATSLFLWPEMALRVAGARFDSAGTVQFGYPRAEDWAQLRRDPDLFWTLSPDGRTVNSDGFPGPELVLPKPDGVRRVVFLGDSCAQQGYPFAVAHTLNRTADRATFEAVNLGVSGYSSYQGVRLAERWLERLQPDVTAIHFGWNDHWLAYGARDSGKRPSTTTAFVVAIAESSRLVQWLARLRSPAGPKPLGTPRVSLAEYRDNLREIGERAERSGSRVLLLTAPSSHRTLGVPDYLTENGFAATKQRVLDLHAAYNDVVRQVAHERGWSLLDLAEHPDVVDRPADIFSADGIHFTNAGLMWMGERVAEAILY